MRLLYLRLPHYGPLRDAALVFPRVDVLKDRTYFLHFVVGVNGTGKSSALRALFIIFDRIARNEWPDFDFELAYELEAHDSPGRTLTVAIARSGTAKKNSWGLLHANAEPLTSAALWRSQFSIWKNDPSQIGHDDVINPSFVAYLPTGVLAYTSGLIDPWRDLQRVPLDGLDIESLRNSETDESERPATWSVRQELATAAALWRGDAVMPEEEYKEWRALLRRPARIEPGWLTRLADPLDVRLAGLTVALRQAVDDLETLPDTGTQSAQRHRWADERKNAAKSKGDVDHSLRWLLTAAGLAWPTHLVFTFDRNARAQWSGDTAERLLLLYTLAESVSLLPFGQERVVISMHHRDTANIDAVLRNLLGEDETETLIQSNNALADTLRTAGAPKYGAQALARVLGGRDTTALAFFRTLTFWRDQGLLIEATATFRRIDGDSVVTYEQLSDGEQQLLQRGGLLLLLQDAPGHLLLLDEPETHFNDRWKRELIDVIDDNLRSTRSHVVLTTHSSIVLSDAFRDEIIVLTPEGVFHPSMPTFGADPGRILQHVFQSPDSIGQRAREALASWLKTYGDNLDDAQRAQLTAILREVGGGPERIRLTERLHAASPGS